MRDQAHLLENETALNLADVLTLRRHEKDFLLRKEKQYIDKFNELADRLVSHLNAKRDRDAIAVLENYRLEFNALVEVTFKR